MEQKMERNAVTTTPPSPLSMSNQLSVDPDTKWKPERKRCGTPRMNLVPRWCVRTQSRDADRNCTGDSNGPV